MAVTADASKPDDVLIVMDIWDGQPVSGVAIFNGDFVSFKRVFDEEAQGWSKTDFRVQRLTGPELAQFNELHERYMAWQAAYAAGNKAPHPLLPEATGPDADRYRALHWAVDAILHADTKKTLHCAGAMTFLPDRKRYVVNWL